MVFHRLDNGGGIPFTDGIFDQVGDIVGFQFFHDAGAVVLSGAGADKQHPCDLLAGFTFCN